MICRSPLIWETRNYLSWVVFREHRVHCVLARLPVAAGPHINTTSEAWERNEIFRLGKRSRARVESVAYIDAPRRSLLKLATDWFSDWLTRVKLESATRLATILYLQYQGAELYVRLAAWRGAARSRELQLMQRVVEISDNGDSAANSWKRY